MSGGADPLVRIVDLLVRIERQQAEMIRLLKLVAGVGGPPREKMIDGRLHVFHEGTGWVPKAFAPPKRGPK